MSVPHHRRAIRIAVGVDAPCDLRLATTRTGCWSAFFGEMDLPDDRALDQLATLAGSWTAMPERVVLIGSPAACLLPALWLRTIWLGPQSAIELDCPVVAPSGENPREQLAAQLCAKLVNEVCCAGAEAAAALWGIEPGPVEPAGPWVFDHILGLLDSWDIQSRGGSRLHAVPWLARTRAAFESCIDRGKTRIGLYGAGTHTRALGPLLMEPRLDLACIIDDSPAVHGSRLWGYPIVSREQALGMSLQAVVLSANSHEHKLWDRSQPFRDAGVEVVRLYAPEQPAVAQRARVAAAAEPKPVRAVARRSPLGLSGAAPESLAAMRVPPVLGALAIQPGVADFWASLDASLRRAGSALYAVVAHTEVPTPPITSVFGAFGTTAQMAQLWPQDAPLGPEPERDLYQRCLAYDRFYWRTAEELPGLTLRGVRAATWLYDHAVRRLRPGLGLVLNGDASAFAVAEHVFRARGVPILYCERGAFNPSVVFDRLGVEGRMISELTDDPARLAQFRAPPTECEITAGKRIGEYLAAKRPQNWQPSPASAAGRVPVDSSRVIACFPSYEPTQEARQRSAPTDAMPFGNSLHAAEALCRAAADLEPDVRIVFKPHPRDPDRHEYKRLADQCGQVFADDLTIFDAADAGWAIATTSASVAWMAAALSCPLVTLARHACGLAGAAMAPTSARELSRDLRAALAGDGRETRVRLGLALAARYASEYSLTVDADLHGLGFADVARAAERLQSVAAPGASGSAIEWLGELAAAGLIPEPLPAQPVA